MPRKSGTATALSPGSSETAPRPTPCRMKGVHQQCCTLGRVRPAPLAHRSRMDMDRSARLFLCARCRDQVFLCSHCDRGQQYCSRACSSLSRRERRRETAARYQSSRGGRFKHAARTACWRERRRSLRRDSARGEVDRVTHQGCLVEAAGASLSPCDIPTANEPPMNSVSVSVIDSAPASADMVPFATPVCRRCAHPLLPHVRLRYLRPIGVRSRGAHDHSS